MLPLFKAELIRKEIAAIILLSLSWIFSQSATALVIEETSYEEVEKRAAEAQKLYQPLLDHFETMPEAPDSTAFNSEISIAELVAISEASDSQRLAYFDKKFGGSIDNDAGRQVIAWLSRQNSLEKNLLNKLGSYVHSDNPECGNLINVYRNKIISVNEDTIDHLKKYKDNYKAFNFLIQWIFSLDYANRVYIRQEALILTNICVNPNPFITGDFLREPLPDSTYVGKSIEPTLRKY
ncbi:hypothetical protein M3P05_12990 [Sansalvadorimonas sp. 2012CJ34-2]|uniref:Uncharacterized protein n=1 Tax=Parendozoicomonas callyspongiae TaxID=2942213 RepID=A0ABT0PHK2_9GAMM|nr:hypothetical protein [Sansalvadorimonas sp. 2012CJ34-2]MCL6270839.1 hypothetical protein [Sansalvadorimonas sp. 2012CJ34-2]